VKNYLFEHARVPLGNLSDDNIVRRLNQFAPYLPGLTAEQRDRPVPIIKGEAAVHVIVVGGAGKHSVYIPTFGPTRPVTLPLKLKDGTLAKSVEAFRQG
jgi:hypothetical protein